jgi:DNA-directed RNA polymerase specialized sigma24 family protein
LIEELLITDKGISPEGNCLLKEFREFIETLPENRRRAIKLRQDGHTYEKTAEILSLQGIKCTNVTVRKWCRDSLESFFGDVKEAEVKKVARV